MNGRRVLVIDGDPAWQQTLTGWLTDWGYAVSCFAPDGPWSEALAQASGPQLELVIVDPFIVDPGEPSVGLIKQVADALRAQSQVPILAMTSVGDGLWLENCVASGASDILMKPFHPALLKVRLAAWRRLRSSGDAVLEANRELEQRVMDRTQEIQELNSLFLRFVPRQLQDRIFRTRRLETGAYESADLTILFLDVRGFTTYAEERGTTGVVEGLSRLFEKIVPLISEYQGFVDNFSGDSFMAVFEGESSAENAVASAVAIQRLMQLPGFSLRVGIGINSGPVVFAALGAEERISSTVLGDQVNLCARIEKFTKTMGAQILVSDATWEKLPPGLWRDESRFVDHLKVRGRNRPARIMEIFTGDPEPIREAKTVIRDRFEAAIQAYSKCDFETALVGFRECLQEFPQDLVALEYVKRCRYFSKNRPDPQFFERGLKEGEEYIDPAVRRRYPRYILGADVELEFIHNDPVLVDQRLKLPGRLVDISVQGLMLESQHCPPQGGVFELRVSFAGTPLEGELGRGIRRFVCQVRWNSPGNPARIGVLFVQLSDAEENQLAQAIEKASAQGAIAPATS